MKNKLKRIAQVLLCCFLLIVWSCETEKLVTDEQTPQAKSILSAKTWFNKYESNGINYELFQNLEYNWSEANITKSEDGTETIIVPVIELKEDKEEIWSQKLYLYKLDEGNFKALLFEIYPDKDVLASSQTIDGGDFNGYMATWDLKNGFIKAAQFENNKVVLEGKISILSSINNEQGKMIADPCYYCPDEEEPTGGSGGFPGIPLREVIIKSPSSPPSFPPMTFIPRGPSYGGVINPSEYTNPPRGGGGSSGGGVTAPAPVQIIDALTGKAKCIYEKLKSSSTGFENAIKKFDGEFTLYDLKLTINNKLDANVYGITIPPVNYVTEIQLDNTKLETLSDLGNAIVFAHEIIHAEIYRKMLSAAQHGNLDDKTMNTQQQIAYVNSLKDNFPGLYDYYYKRFKATWNHEMMANHYRGAIADIIQQFDNNRLPRLTYEKIAWVGLGKLEKNVTSIAWDNLSAIEKESVTKLINEHFYKGPSNCK